MARVICTSGDEPTAELSAAANGREAVHAFTAGLEEKQREVKDPGGLGFPATLVVSAHAS